MRRLMAGGALAAAVGMALAVATPLSASAQLARPQTALGMTGNNDLVTDVQWRGRGGWRGGWRGYHRGWGGPAIGLGLGLATGALIGSALAAPYYDGPYYAPPPTVYYEVPDHSDSVAYCMQRFRSYDPSSGTYLGYDGERHPCP